MEFAIGYCPIDRVPCLWRLLLFIPHPPCQSVNLNRTAYMFKFKLFILISVLFVSFAISAPPLAGAAHKTSSQKTEIKKSSAKSQSTARKKKQLTARAARKSTPEKAKKTVAASERDVWLKRAKNSEALTGKASWYGKDFHNKATASGLAYDMHTFTAAHRTLPMGTIVKVTDQNNGKSVMVCVTDRGPFIKDRIIDVSYAAARKLGLSERGVGKVELEVVGDVNGAPLKKGQAYFVQYASGTGQNKVGPYHAFADAAAMQEALSQAHPEAEVILAKESK